VESVPYIDLFARPAAFLEARKRAVMRVLDTGPFIGGSEVESFEQEWAAFIGVNHCVGVGNGLDAITLGLRALGIGRGDYVALPAHTFIATWLAVLHVGATPIGVDCDHRGQMDPVLLDKLDPAPNAVIVTHMHGIAADIRRIAAWASSNGVLLLEDCAQAHGAMIDGRPLGSWGHVGAFSFYPTKNLGAFGDAGALVTNDPEVASDARSLANYGSSQADRYMHHTLGVNSRLDPLQAAALKVGLRYLEEHNDERRHAAATYLSLLESEDSRVTCLTRDPEASVWHHFVVRVENRDWLRRSLLDEEGIATEVHYPRVAAHEASDMQGIHRQSFPVAEDLSRRGLSLPIFPGITTHQIEHVVDRLLSLVSRC
jgi:dTDP-4-amino-4,6-dideoxygalactose transaminase